MIKRFTLVIALISCLLLPSRAAQILIAMDDSQKDHLKAYGVAYWVLKHQVEVDWLLNYRGGSFAFIQNPKFETELKARGVNYSVISDAQYNSILTMIASPDANMEVMKLEKLPKIAVYSPKTAKPGEDAVTLVLTYAEIPYDMVFDEEVLDQKLLKYDWLHLHHEDFTGQYGKSGGWRRNQERFQLEKQEAERIANRFNYSKVSHMKLGVAKKIREFVAGGGFMFAMCSATDTYDIALAAEGIDIVEDMYDGDGVDPQAQQKIDYSKTFAFKNFALNLSGGRGFSSIDNQRWERGLDASNDYFSLFTFSAKWDQIPAMLTQNHKKTIRGFMGQTTAFKKEQVKSEANIMGETKAANEVRYMNGTFGKGTWTFYGGHDPEHYPGATREDSPTDLSLHPNSPGYRLILNNILFPAARKKKLKT